MTVSNQHSTSWELVRDAIPDWAQHDPRPAHDTDCAICLGLRALHNLEEQYETAWKALRAVEAIPFGPNPGRNLLVAQDIVRAVLYPASEPKEEA